MSPCVRVCTSGDGYSGTNYVEQDALNACDLTNGYFEHQDYAPFESGVARQ